MGLVIHLLRVATFDKLKLTLSLLESEDQIEIWMRKLLL